MLEQRDAEDAARLQALRDAAATGLAALDRGAFAEFAEPDALLAHLDALADRVFEGRAT